MKITILIASVLLLSPKSLGQTRGPLERDGRNDGQGDAALLRGAKAVEYLEPNVQRYAGVLPPSVCERLIELGEKSGFLVMEVFETIDGDDDSDDPTKEHVPAQQIDVYSARTEPGKDDDAVKIDHEAIWAVLEPWVPTITKIVKTNRNEEEFRTYYPDEPDKEPDLNWVFFRKYSPHSERNSLSLHHDTNMNTLNIELSDDYEGGGFFYVKPLTTTGERADKYGDDDKWVKDLKRENASDLVFPDLHTGDCIFYNYTVEHGVAPLKSGTRYSMAFFFDMDNPAVGEDFDDDDPDDDDDPGDNVEIEDEDDSFAVELHNGLSLDLEFVQVYDAAQKSRTWIKISDKVAPDGATIHHAIEGDVLWALIEGTDEAVSEIVIRRNQSVYTLSKVESLGKHSFNVEVHNGLPGVPLDLVLVYDAAHEKGVWDMFDNVMPDESTTFKAYDGDMLWAMIEGTDEAVSEIKITHDSSLYTISDIVYLLNTEL